MRVNNLKSRVPKFWIYFLVFASQVVILQRVMRLDPDPHHDGILYGAAVSVKNGGFPNRDAFAQYGPLVPEVQGLALKIFGPSLLNIRMQALSLFIVSSILIWYVVSRYISKEISLLVSSAWAFTIPSVLPWPTIYSTFLALVSLLLMTDFANRTLRTQNRNFLVSSFFLGIGVFARIHLIAIFLAVCIVLCTSSNLRRKLIPWSLGFFSALGSIFFLLFINGGVASYISQCISWPLLRYAGPPINKSYVVGLLWYPGISIAFLFLCFMLGWSRNILKSKLVVGLISSLLFIAFFFISRIARVGYLSLRNPRVMAIDFGRNMMNSLDYFSALAILVIAVAVFFKRKTISSLSKISLAFGIGILTQLYPLYDVNHLWLISPLLIVALTIILGEFDFYPNFLKRGFPFVLIGLLSALLLQIGFFTSVPRAPFASASLRGMYAPAAFEVQLDQTMNKLSKNVRPGTASFDCLNGIYAGSGGKYLASSNQFVNWGPNPEQAKTGSLIFVCAISEAEISSYTSNHYEILFKDPLTLFGDSKPRGFWNVLFAKASGISKGN
jgi:hypothetical protein